jgi:hypothetical protein
MKFRVKMPEHPELQGSRYRGFRSFWKPRLLPLPELSKYAFNRVLLVIRSAYTGT